MRKLLFLFTLVLCLILLPAVGFGQEDVLSDITTGTLRSVDKDDKILELPLKHTEVTAEISGSISQVVVEQEFINPYKTPIEAIYVFPLPQDAAVDQMEMHIGDKVIKAEIKKSEEARQIYEQAKIEGKRTALLEQERPNIFTQSVANIMPGDSIKIRIRYFQILPYADGKFSFIFPTVVGPRYIPGAGVPDANNITPPAVPPGFRSGHDLGLTVKINANDLTIKNLKSVNHEISSENTGSQATISISPLDAIPNKDFILEYSVAQSVAAFTFLTYKPQNTDGFFALLALPPLTAKAESITPKELFFVVDTSGSMSGEPIETAKSAMRYALNNLNPADTFYLIKFSNTVERFDTRPRENSPADIKAALSFVDNIRGGGGTEMLKGVKEALETPKAAGRLRIVVFITDAYVGNESEILAAIQAKADNGVRFFPLGVGQAPNRFLIEEMARVGRGQSSYLPLGQDPAEKIKLVYEKISSPLLTDVSLSLKGVNISEVTPDPLPDIFAGRPLMVFGRYAGGGTATLTIKATETYLGADKKIAARPYTYSKQVILPSAESGNSALASVWAKNMINELSGRMYQGQDPQIVEKITNLGLAYNLVTDYTSFVAVEEKVVNENGKISTVRVPVPIPEGTQYGGFFGDTAEKSMAAPARSGGMQMSLGYGAPTGLGTGSVSSGIISLAALVVFLLFGLFLLLFFVFLIRYFLKRRKHDPIKIKRARNWLIADIIILVILVAVFFVLVSL